MYWYHGTSFTCMQELKFTKHRLQHMTTQLHNLLSLMCQHAHNPDSINKGVAARCDTVQQQKALTIRDKASQAVKAYTVLRSQANVETASSVSHSFKSVIIKAQAKKNAEEQAILQANREVHAQCMAAALAEYRIRSQLHVLQRRRLAIRATIAASRSYMHTHATGQQVLREALMHHTELQLDSGRDMCISHSKSHAMCFSTVAQCWSHRLLQEKRRQGTVSCIMTAKKAHHTHRSCQSAFSTKCVATVALYASMARKARRQSIKAAKECSRVHEQVQSTFTRISKAALACTSHIDAARPQTSQRTRSKATIHVHESNASRISPQPPKRAVKKDPVMGMLAAAIQMRMGLSKNSTASNTQTAAWAPPASSSQHGLSPSVPTSCASVHVGEASGAPDSTPAGEERERRRRSLHPAVLQAQQYREEVQELDAEVCDLGDRLQQITTIAHKRASTYVASPPRDGASLLHGRQQQISSGTNSYEENVGRRVAKLSWKSDQQASVSDEQE